MDRASHIKNKIWSMVYLFIAINTRNAFGTVTNVSDATGLTHVYAVNDRQSATNETVTISGDTVFTLDRALDGRNRVENTRVTVGGERLGETVSAPILSRGSATWWTA